MTKTQLKFYNMLKQQIVDFEEIFHKDFMVQRIEKIEDDRLKFLLEEINLDKEKISKKGYITYAKFIHYADKFIDQNILRISNNSYDKKVESLYQKRDLMLKSIENSAKNINERNDLIEQIQSKKLMFKEDGKNILDECDYFIIEQFGFYNFFDENRNYHLKEDIHKYLAKFIENRYLVKNKSIKKLT